MKIFILLGCFLSFNAMADHFHCHTRTRTRIPQPLRTFVMEHMDQYRNLSVSLKNLDAYQKDLRTENKMTTLTFTDNAQSEFIIIFPEYYIDNLLENRLRSIPGILKYSFPVEDIHSGESEMREGMVKIYCQKRQW